MRDVDRIVRIEGDMDVEKLAAQQKTLAQTNFQTAVIYDRNGGKLHELFGEGRRTDIKLAAIPKVVIDATLATEDNSFYDNPGVDLGGVIVNDFIDMRDEKHRRSVERVYRVRARPS
ncbi:hypothetical protein B4Q13_15020 [Lacticaseibacillus rhamnosus]